MTQLEALAELLGRERTLLDVLVYRLVELRALLISGDGRFLTWAAEEVEDATAAVRAAELERALLLVDLAEAFRMHVDTLTLSVLVGLADPPWRALLADHREALQTLSAEVEDHSSAVRRLARTASEAVAAQLDRAVGVGAARP
jgi:hypothetical protein